METFHAVAISNNLFSILFEVILLMLLDQTRPCIFFWSANDTLRNTLFKVCYALLIHIFNPE